MRLYRFFNMVSEMLNRACKAFCLIIGSVLVVNLFLGVFTRFVLNNPLGFTEEIARFCMLWFAFIGGSIALRQKELISFTFLIDKAPKTVRQGMRILNLVLVIVFLSVFLAAGTDAMKIFRFGKASVTKINQAWTASGIYVGAAVMLIHCITDLLKEFSMVLQKGKGEEGL
ncbi:TRAP transporter small permease [Clostridiaceae bacterium]|nr:TRAP transporter small permease [Clostridiaceae bacterium]RKI10582.1 TRAP transporter small permease [bacterium 1XD21-70]